MTTEISATSRHFRALWLVFAITATYLVVEVAGGLLTNSLALLADAAHMLTDVGGLLSLFAAWMSRRAANHAKTYGYYRVEILAALLNAAVLFAVSFYILYEAYRRMREPSEVVSLPMLLVAVVGLAVNLVGIWLLRQGSRESLNVQGAFLEVVSDLLSSVGAVIAGAIMLTTGWYYADPLFGVLIGLFILPRTGKLMTQAVNILLEGTPAHVNLASLQQAMEQVDGVASVHDLHAWTITSGMDALSAHVVLKEPADLESASLTRAKLAALLRDRFKIAHSTIQAERLGEIEEPFPI